MKKVIGLGILAVMLVSSVLSPATVTATDGQYTTPKFTYGVKVNDEFIYNLYFNVTLGFENSSVYDEIGRWAAEMAGEEIVGNLTDDFFGIVDNFTRFIIRHGVQYG